ncbi:MAG: helix-turn-helix transcriptional regulator [Pseudomonadales bacterium]|nr:helix-turn-helix transcriptional regulator [Pseudomonadales bacterium]
MKAHDAVETLTGLAQETRLNIFRELVRAATPDGSGGLTPSVLSQKLDIPSPTLSFHLKELTRAGLVTSTRHGRSLNYAANISCMQALIAFLMEDCCKDSQNG